MDLYLKSGILFWETYIYILLPCSRRAHKSGWILFRWALNSLRALCCNFVSLPTFVNGSVASDFPYFGPLHPTNYNVDFSLSRKVARTYQVRVDKNVRSKWSKQKGEHDSIHIAIRYRYIIHSLHMYGKSPEYFERWFTSAVVEKRQCICTN